MLSISKPMLLESSRFVRSAMAMTLFSLPWLAGLLSAPFVGADEPTLSDVLYGSVGDIALRLDFYEPTQRRQERPLIVWVHGGAWRSGSKSGVPIVKLREQGFAIASVDYRLSPVAKFPAQIHDIKSAIRFLRANADRFGVVSAANCLAHCSIERMVWSTSASWKGCTIDLAYSNVY